MRKVTASKTILSTSAADVAQNDATLYDIEGADQVLVDVQITGTLTCTIDFDIHGDASSIAQQEFTSSSQYVQDDPMGNIRAWTNGCGGGESCTVKIRSVFFDSQRIA